MRISKRVLFLTVFGLFAFSLEGGSEERKPITIGVMPKLVGIDYFNEAEKGAKEAAAELGVKLVYEGPIANDVTKQAEMLDSWIARRMDAIAVAPDDPHALAPTLKKAISKGIKILTWDADSDVDGRQYFVNQVTYESIGDGLVEIMAEQIGGKGETAIVTGSMTAANQNLWMEAMKKRIAAKYPEMKIVTVKPSEVDQDLAFRVTQDLLKAYPNLKGIFAITSAALPGTALAVRESGKSGKIAVTGLAAPNAMRQYVKDGTVKSFILWSPADLGYLTVYAAKELVEKGTLPETLPAGRLGTVKITNNEILLGQPIVFTAENIDKFDF